MFPALFQSNTIPVLEQMVSFSQARHSVLAGNIANLDTPGYKVRDLSVDDFQSRLKDALETRRKQRADISPGELAYSGITSSNRRGDGMLAKASEDSKSIVYHDKSNVGLEYQVTEVLKNQMQHNLALTIMKNQFNLLEAAISGKA